MLYEMLTGRVPFEGPTPSAVAVGLALGTKAAAAAGHAYQLPIKEK